MNGGLGRLGALRLGATFRGRLLLVLAGANALIALAGLGAVAVLHLAGPVAAQGCTINWTGAAGNGLWATPANWDAGRVPGPTDYACIPETASNVRLSTGTEVVVLGVDARGAGGLTITGTSTRLRLTSPAEPSTIHALNLSGDLVLDAGVNLSLTGAGTWTNNGRFTGPGTTTVVVGASLVISTSGNNVYVENGHTFVNQGTVTWSGNDFLSMGTGTVFRNAGRFELTHSGPNDIRILVAQGAGNPLPRIDNLPGGTISRNGAVGVEIEVALNNDGLIEGVAGRLELEAGNTPGESDSGTIDVAPGAVVELTAGTRTFASPAREVGAGRMRIFGGTVTGDLRIEGTVEWFGGAMTGPGTTTVAPAGTLLLTSTEFTMAATLDGGHTLLNQGTVDWSGGGGMEMGTSAVFTNAEGGRFVITMTGPNQGEITDVSGTGTPDPRIDNLPGGTITRNGAVVAEIGVQLNNDGLIQGVAGTLRLAAGGTPGESDSGTIDVAAGAVVEMTGGTRAFVSPAKEQGAGVMRIAGGTLTGVFRIEGTVEWFGGTITGPGTTTVAPGGTLRLTSSAFNIAATLDGGHTLLNQGTVAWTATGGIEMGTGAVFTNADGGRFDITGGQGAITDVSGAGTPDPRIENLPGAIVTRNGTSVATIGVPFTNQGTIRLLTGTLQIANNFTNQAGATLEYVISGPDPGTGFGRLAVTGTFTAGGNLVVTNAPGFTPTEGQTFTIITCGACTGTFANVSSPYPVQYNPTNITLNAVGPAVGLNPTALGFGDQVVGTTSSAQTVTVTNTGSVPLTITSATVTGSNAAEFTKTADTCTNATVAAGATCTVSVTFTPSAQGPRSAALTVQDNAAGSPHTVPLTGTGTTASAAACTITWTGGAGTGQWTTAANWSPVRVPNTTDFACIPGTVAEEVVISAGANVVRGVRAEGAGGLRQTGGTLRLTDTTAPSLIRDFRFAGGTVAVDTGVSLVLQGTAVWTRGVFTGGGVTTVASGATLNVPAGATGAREIVLGHDLRNEGTINWTGGDIGCLRDGGRLVNAGLFTIQSDGGRIFPCSGNPASQVENVAGGQIVRSGSGTTTIEVFFDNDGIVQVDSGTMRIAVGNFPGQNDSGTMRIASGATLELAGGQRDFVAPARAEGAGTLVFSGGDLRGDVVLAGHTRWLGGGLSGAGTTLVPAGAVFDVPPGANGERQLQRGHVLRNEGTVNWTGGDVGCLRDGGLFTNAGTFNMQSDGGRIFICSGNPAPLLRNEAAGRIVKSGAGITTIELPFENDGVVQVDSGTLRIVADNNGLADTGTISISSGATVELSGFMRTFAAPARVEGAGTLVFVDGTITGDLVIAGNATWLQGAFADAGTTTIAPTGVLTIPAGATGERQLARGHVLRNEGTVNWTGGDIGCVRDGGTFANAGTFNIRSDGGRFFICPGNPAPLLRNETNGVIVRSGTGTTTIDVPFDNDGTVRVESGILRVEGAFTNGTGATLAFVIGGPTPGTDFGQFQVSGPCTMGGSLVATNAPGFTATAGQTFPVVVCDGGRSGTFADTTSPYAVRYDANGVTLVAGSPGIGFSPTALGFGDHTVGTNSPPQTVTVTNTGQGPLTISSVTVSGTDAADFTTSADTCSGATISPSATCSVSVTFAPSATGPRVATLTFSDNAPGSPHTVGLSGTGLAPPTGSPAVGLSTVSMAFAGEQIGATGPAQTVTLTNTGTAPLTVTSVAITGTNAGDFTKAADTCTGATLAPSATCTVSVTFAPSAVGPRTATLTFTDNAPDSPQTLVLSGTGIASPAGAPGVGLSPVTLTFASQQPGTTSPAQSVTLTNTGNAPLTVTSVGITGGNSGDFTRTADTCTGATIAPNGTCTVSLAFTPTAPGARTATLTFTDNAPGSPHTVALSGTGADTPNPVPPAGAAVTVNPAAVNFGNQQVGTVSTFRPVTVTNTGTLPVAISNVVVQGAAREFPITADSCTGATLAPGGSCTVAVAFVPALATVRTATLTISDNAPGGPRSVALSGTGTAAPAPISSVPTTPSTTAPTTTLTATTATTNPPTTTTTTTTTATTTPTTTTTTTTTPRAAIAFVDPPTPLVTTAPTSTQATEATTTAVPTTTAPVPTTTSAAVTATTSSTAPSTTVTTVPASTSTTAATEGPGTLAAPGSPTAPTAPSAPGPGSLLAISPSRTSSGPPGVALEVASSGYPPDCEKVYFFFDGRRVGTADADGGTVGRSGLAVPGDARPGRHTVTSSCRPSGTPVVHATEFVVQEADLHRTAFATSLPKPRHVEFTPLRVLLSALAALGLLMLIAFPAELFNTTLEEHYDEVRSWFRLPPRDPSAGTGLPHLALFVTFLALSGPLWFVMQDSSALDAATAVAALGLSLATAVVVLASDSPTFAYLRRTYRERPRVVALPGSLVVAVVCVLLSRAVNFEPGYFYGLVGGLAFSRRLRRDVTGRLAATSAVILIVLSLVSWVVLDPVSEAAAQPDAGLGLLLAESFLGSIFWAALDSLIIALIPLRLLAGSKITGWNRRVWMAIYVVTLFAFVHILLRPGTGYVADTSRSPALVVVALFVAFAVLSLSFWGYFRFRQPRPAVVR